MHRFSLAAFAMVCMTTSAAADWTYDSKDTSAPLADVAELLSGENYAAALAKLQALETDKPNDADVLNLMGYSYRKLGNLDQSGVYYTRALEIEPNHLGALEYQGELFLMLGDRAAAQANLARLTVLCPSGCEERTELEAALAGS